jgi:hypothetical protein
MNFKIAKIIAAILLLLAIAKMPSGYYTFLRAAIFIISILCIYEFWHKLRGFIVPFILIASIFNPIFPVYFYDRSIWMPIDIISAVVFIVAIFINPKTKAENHEDII